MYLKKDDEPSWLLGLFAIVNIVLLNVVELPATVNTYRFLVYAALPISLFAGLVFSRWLTSREPLKAAAAAAVILLMVPSTLLMVGFYNGSSYTHASAAEYEALQWIKENTPKNAVIYEEPGFLPARAGGHGAGRRLLGRNIYVTVPQCGLTVRRLRHIEHCRPGRAPRPACGI